jgi:hypothetical protein
VFCHLRPAILSSEIFTHELKKITHSPIVRLARRMLIDQGEHEKKGGEKK